MASGAHRLENSDAGQVPPQEVVAVPKWFLVSIFGAFLAGALAGGGSAINSYAQGKVAEVQRAELSKKFDALQHKVESLTEDRHTSKDQQRHIEDVSGRMAGMESRLNARLDSLEARLDRGGR